MTAVAATAVAAGVARAAAGDERGRGGGEDAALVHLVGEHEEAAADAEGGEGLELGEARDVAAASDR